MPTEIFTTSDNVDAFTYSMFYSSSSATWSTSTINVSYTYADMVNYYDTLSDMLMYGCPKTEKRKSIYEED